MKKIIILLGLVFASWSISAQRVAVVDSKSILEKLPEYTEAQQKLDQFSAQWEQEIKVAFEKVEKMYKAYQAESSMLDDNMKKQREDEIMNREREAKALQKKYFGYEGELYTKRESLMRPIQDKVYSAVQDVASKESYDIILDKSAGVTVFYNNPRFDISSKVMASLGVN